MRAINLASGAMTLVCLAFVGCGSKGLPSKVMYGSITCGDEKVPMGRVSFVPIEGALGPNASAPIVNGEYRVDVRGGVPLGKHRVCVDARKKTGRQVEGSNGMEVTMIDETVRMGPETYIGEQSPVVIDIQAGTGAKFDIAIPRD